MQTPISSPGQTKKTLLYWDLVAAVFLGLALLQLAAVFELAPGFESQFIGKVLAAARLVTGFAFVLFVPGYLLQAILFPRRQPLDSIERVGLSLGLSIALGSMLILLVDRLPWGVRLWPVAVSQVSLVVLLAGLAAWRRSRLPLEELDVPAPPFGLASWWRSQPSTSRGVYIFSLLVFLFVGAAILWTLRSSKQEAFFTEFYMLGPTGLAEDYPRLGRAGQPLQVTLGVVNRERLPQTYRAEVWVMGAGDDQRQLLEQRQPFNLKPGDSLEWQQSWSMPNPGSDQQVQFLLFVQGQEAPYRQLSLWLNIDP